MDELLDVFEQHKCSILPNASNICRIMYELVHKELLQQGMFTMTVKGLNSYQTGLANFPWGNIRIIWMFYMRKSGYVSFRIKYVYFHF